MAFKNRDDHTTHAKGDGSGEMQLACAVVALGVKDFIRDKEERDYLFVTGIISREWLDAANFNPLKGEIDELHERLLSMSAQASVEIQLGKKLVSGKLPLTYDQLYYNARLRLHNPEHLPLIPDSNRLDGRSVKAKEQKRAKSEQNVGSRRRKGAKATDITNAAN